MLPIPNSFAIRFGVIALGIISTFMFGYHQGGASVRADWMAHEADVNAQQAKAIADANERVRAIERKHALVIADITDNFQRQLKEKDDEKNTAIASMLANGLYVNAECPTCGNATGGTSTCKPTGSREKRVRLSNKDAEFLIRIASEADQVVEQLSACQAILKGERK